MNIISLTSTEAANYDSLYFIPVEVNNLTDEEKLWYNLLSDKYANITTYSESYSLTNIYVRDDES